MLNTSFSVIYLEGRENNLDLCALFCHTRRVPQPVAPSPQLRRLRIPRPPEQAWVRVQHRRGGCRAGGAAQSSAQQQLFPVLSPLCNCSRKGAEPGSQALALLGCCPPTVLGKRVKVKGCPTLDAGGDIFILKPDAVHLTALFGWIECSFPWGAFVRGTQGLISPQTL